MYQYHMMIIRWQVRELRFESSRRLDLDDVLLIFGQTGVISYNIFTIIASYFQLGEDGDSILVLVIAVAALLQVLSSPPPEYRRGDVVTYLLIPNRRLPKPCSFWTQLVETLSQLTNSVENQDEKSSHFYWLQISQCGRSTRWKKVGQM